MDLYLLDYLFQLSYLKERAQSYKTECGGKKYRMKVNRLEGLTVFIKRTFQHGLS